MYLVGEQQQVLKGQLYVEKGHHGELITHELEGTDYDMYQPTSQLFRRLASAAAAALVAQQG